MGVVAKAYGNCDHAYVVWQVDQRIAGCRGFALYRRSQTDSQPQILPTWVGFQGDAAPLGTMTPSTQWPVQKFMWSDYLVQSNETVQYQVVPMVGTKEQMQPDADLVSAWTDPITISASVGDGTSAYFNRGIVASQWLSRALGAPTPADEQTSLKTIMSDVNDKTRQFMAGELLRALVDLLNKVKNSQTSTYAGDRIYAALFELNDPELIPALEALGDRANLILANGSTQQPGGDENAAARQELRGKVNLYDRMVGVGHLAHNKFLIVCDADDQPQAVWTGSTNWQMTGLCTQANNGILLENAQIAGWFKAQWDLLKGAGNDFPPNLINADDQKKSVTIGDRQVTAWFTPVHGLVDLSDAETMINAAQQGILFLMFNPGPEGTLLNAIVNRSISGNPTYDPNLYIHGVLNQDPSTTAHPIVGLFHRGQYTESNLDVVLPAAIDHRFAYWDEEIKKYQYAWAMVHSKVIVIDPFGPHPVVMTGSHNLGPKASSANDDNLVIVQGDPALAQAYAVNIMAIYNQYRWRYLMSTQSATASAGQPAAAAAPAPVATTVPLGAGTAVATHAEIWSGLQDNDTWQDDYFTGAKLRELNFWMGRG